MATCCLIDGDVGRRLRLDQQIGDREAGVRDVLQRAVVGRVQRRHAEQAARGDLGDADDHAAVVVELELGADLRVLEFVELRVLDRDEGVLGEDVLDLAAQKRGPAEQAGVVEADDVRGLVGAVVQLEERGAGIERHGIFDARECCAPRPARSPAAEWCWRPSGRPGSITQIEAPILMTVAEARFSMPANSEVISIIRKTANVMPTSSAANLARSLTSSL